MSVEDLAIDVGLAKDSDEYISFVACVDNILELGNQYSKKATDNIIEKCQTSELEIANEVIRACREKKVSPIRTSRLKWWQTYTPKYQRISTNIHVDKRPRATHKDNETRNRRPMSPLFEERRKRPMSPMFQGQPKRPMSPMFQEKRSDVPQWPGRRPDRQQRYERRERPDRRQQRYDRRERPSYRQQRYDRRERPSYRQHRHKRPMSPMFQEEPPVYERKKRRKFR